MQRGMGFLLAAGAVTGLMLVALKRKGERAEDGEGLWGGWGELPDFPDLPELPDWMPFVEPEPAPTPLELPAPSSAARLVDPAGLVYPTTAQRDAWFGPLTAVPAPTAGNPEAVRITNDFEARNIIRKAFPLVGTIQIHRAAAPSLEAALTDIVNAGLGGELKRFAGSYVPRFVRGSTTNLSSHSYGTSIDVNDHENPQGSPPTAGQARLAPFFERRGWFWADRYKTSKRDPMHFEFILPPGMV